MILACKFQILGIKTTVGHYIIIFSRNSSCLIRLSEKTGALVIAFWLIGWFDLNLLIEGNIQFET